LALQEMLALEVETLAQEQIHLLEQCLFQRVAALLVVGITLFIMHLLLVVLVVAQVVDTQAQQVTHLLPHLRKGTTVEMARAEVHQDQAAVAVELALLARMELSHLLLLVMVATVQLGLATELRTQGAERVVLKAVEHLEQVEQAAEATLMLLELQTLAEAAEAVRVVMLSQVVQELLLLATLALNKKLMVEL
jgi:hypothetical protein